MELTEICPLLLFVADHASAGIAILDEKMRYLAASPAFIEQLGLGQSVDTRTISGILHYDLFPEIPERWRKVHRRVLAGEVIESEKDSVTRPDGRIVHLHWKMMPWRGEDGLLGGAVLFCTVSTELKTLERRSPDERARVAGEFVTLADNIPTLCWMAYANGDIYWYNKRWYEYTGTSPESQKGWGWESVHDPEVLPVVMRQWKQSLETGERFEMTFPLKGADGIFQRFLTRIIPIRDNDEKIVRWFGTNTNIEEQKLAEERERLLAREVDHRAKNMLAVVQAMVQLSRGTDIASYKEALTQRIHALSRAHSLLAADRWQGVQLRELVNEEMAPFGGADQDRISVTGPPLILNPGAAQTFALLLHELTTNSVKHGALSHNQGSIVLSWAEGIQTNPGIHVRWQEFGGPPIVPPKREGFGLKLLRASVERQLNGKLSLAWQAEGLICDLTVPPRHFVAAARAAEIRKKADPDSGPSAVPNVRRALIVEDEALVGMELEATLTRAGIEVLGPATDVRQAIDLLSETDADIVLLDINLNGEKSFLVAEALTKRSTPFIFCTGYAAHVILPPRFSHVPVLAKPYTVDQLFHAMNRAVRQPLFPNA